MAADHSQPAGADTHPGRRAPRRACFLGCPLDLLTCKSFLDEVIHTVESKQSATVVQFVNANKVAKIHKDPAFGRVVWRADYVLADGQPMLPLARLLGIKVPERIDGVGLMSRLLELAEQRGWRIYLLGARPDVLEACAAQILRQHPRIRIAGMHHGYFPYAEAPAIAKQAAATAPDLLFLGMGSPTKEFLAEQYRQQFGARVIQGVGGSFDVIAGIVRRAPKWMQRLGLEWLFRVFQEPRRMFWRYAATNTLCMLLFLRALFRRVTGRVPCPRPDWLDPDERA